ncbi:MAG: hypothetical protein JXR07_17845 [Reichenbachiella sp.]
MPDPKYFSNHQVSTKDCTQARTIKLTCLLDSMQDAAWMNATALGFSTLDLLNNNMTWVMNRMNISFYRYPVDNEKYTIETWPSSMNKYITTRDFRIRDENDKVLIEATSNWLVMDIIERKLIPIPDYIKEAGFTVDHGNIEPGKTKLKFDSSKVLNEKRIVVSWFDLDINNHVNNTKFYQWILDSLEGDFLNTHELKEIEIVFKHEGKYGDAFLTQSYLESIEGQYLHRLVNEKSGQESVVAMTMFDKK